MTPQQALTMITNLEAAVKKGTVKPEHLVKGCNRIAREAIGWAISAQRRDSMLLNGLNEVRAAAGMAPIGGQRPGAAQSTAPMAQAVEQVSGVPRGPNGLRLNPDGTEMDADQSAREDIMDSAINAGVQSGEIQPGHTAFTPPTTQASSVETMDGTPVTVAAAPEAPPPVAAAPTPAPAPASAAREAAMTAAINAAASAGRTPAARPARPAGNGAAQKA